ncbi:MAG: hypothetical protein ABJA98_03065 [Acidobacteriota bacterium]
MRRFDLTPIKLLLVIVSMAAAASRLEAGQGGGGRGRIKGTVTLMGQLPGNPVIRMGRDPMCAQINRGKRVVQETVVADLKGNLANAFVSLEGTFPDAPVPNTPVIVDQKSCVYTPRVVGVRAGQTLQIHNSDNLLHNIHSESTVKENTFNIAQPIAGMTNQFKLKEEPRMIRLGCDIHSWMRTYIGVVTHPYFSVSSTTGAFEIADVPPGTYMIQSWHERYGVVKQSVQVRAGAVVTAAFSYTGQENPPPEAPKVDR